LRTSILIPINVNLLKIEITNQNNYLKLVEMLTIDILTDKYSDNMVKVCNFICEIIKNVCALLSEPICGQAYVVRANGGTRVKTFENSSTNFPTSPLVGRTVIELFSSSCLLFTLS
jgi:hypothetical protein